MAKRTEEENTRRRKGAFSWFRSSFLTGLVVIAPIGLTLWLSADALERDGDAPRVVLHSAYWCNLRATRVCLSGSQFR